MVGGSDLEWQGPEIRLADGMSVGRESGFSLV